MPYLIILAGGKGRRFYPITKYYPKEMLPIGHFPALHYVLLEAATNIIDEIIVVYKNHGNILKSYIENECKNFCKKITFVHQSSNGIGGTGTAVKNLKHIVGKENRFAISFSDDVVFDNLMFQNMFDLAKGENLTACIASAKIEPTEIPNFGNLKLDANNIITQILQKPKIEDAVSKTALVSKLVLTPEIFDYIDSSIYKNELDLGIALSKMCLNNQKVKAYDVTGKWITTGDPKNYIQGVYLWQKKFMKKF